MLNLIVPGIELYNEETEEFHHEPHFVLQLEHSLISLSKWESIFEKPFLGKQKKSNDELMVYVECMILNPVFPAQLRARLSQENVEAVQSYIESAQSATTFGKMPDRPGKQEIITAELIYYWLVVFNIPFEVETWHLNRLFALIRICNIKQGKQPKRGKAETARHYRELNAQRRAQYGTTG